MARLNFCTGCLLNFCSASAHAAHRIGKFGSDRRCMTQDEMLAKGFTMAVEPVTRRIEGKPLTSQRKTWFAPMSEQERARLAAMRQKGEQAEVEEPEEDEIAA